MAPKRRSAKDTNTLDSTVSTSTTLSEDVSPAPVSPTADDIMKMAQHREHQQHSSAGVAAASEPRRPRRFKLVRSLALADFITLSNAACGILSMFSCLNFLVNARYQPYILLSFILLPLALVFDILDGSVARWRQSSSPYGKDLDSLADVVSFSVAPSVLAFTLGCRGLFDMGILSYFVCCGIGRLARFNVTAHALSGGTGKVSFYQGFPVPTSVLLVLLMGVLYWRGLVLEQLWGGHWDVELAGLRLGSFHPFSLLFFFVGSMMISEVKIPKP